MNFPRLDFGHLLAQRFRRVAAFIAAAIARLGFGDVLKHAADAFHNFCARADGVNKLDAKLPQALADFGELNGSVLPFSSVAFFQMPRSK